MEPSPTRKCKWRPDDFPARLVDLRFQRFEIAGEDHDQRTAGPDRRLSLESAGESAVLKAGVVRAEILEPPAEDVLVERSCSAWLIGSSMGGGDALH